MENIKSFFDSFKEFIWDIIGYLLPGSFVLILLSVCINPEYFIYPSIQNSSSDFYPFVFFVVSYLLGHVVYGFGWLKEGLLGKYSYVKKIEAKVSKRRAFLISKQLIEKSLADKGIIEDLSNATLRDVRSIAMSFIPEHDQKIYTFTLRSDLSNQTGNISFIVGFLGLVFSLFQKIPLRLFNSDTSDILLYFCLIVAYFFLRQTRNRFYAISMGLPFSIYAAKATKL